MVVVRQLMSIAGLVALCAAAPLQAQTAGPAGDFTNAGVAEVRDSQGQVVLHGQFMPVDENDDDVERKATLAPVGSDADAAGEAEVEYSRTALATQEVEFSVENVSPGAAFTFFIDGIEVATATSDRRGRAEVELDVSMPGSR